MEKNLPELNENLGYYLASLWLFLTQLFIYVMKSPAGVIQYLAQGQENSSRRRLAEFKWFCAFMIALLYTTLAFIVFDLVSNRTITNSLLFIALALIVLVLTYCKFCIDMDEDDWD